MLSHISPVRRFLRKPGPLTLGLAFGLLSCVAAMASSAAEREQEAPATVSVGVEAPKPGSKLNCQLIGPRFHQIGELRACGALMFDLTTWASKEFTSSDILLHGSRLLNPALIPAVPMLAYELKDYSNRTHYPNLTASARVSYFALVPTEMGPVQAFGALRVAGSLHPLKDGGFDTSMPQIFGSKSVALLDQAWVKFRGMHVGYAPSYFGFNRFGYSFLPAYLSSVNLPLFAYTHSHEGRLSLTLSVEDSSRRSMADGILASYGARKYFDGGRPDLVALGRYKLNDKALISVSGALHEMRDEISVLCCAAPRQREIGFAVSAGFETGVDWSSVVDGDAFGRRGAVLGNIAMARGAMNYLGVPSIVTDYVASSDGDLKASKGVAVVLGYRHFIRPAWEAALTANYYRLWSHSAPEPELATNAPFGFDYNATGLKGTFGVSHKWSENVSLGGEFAYTWDVARLKFTHGSPAAIAKAAPVEVNYPTLTLFARVQW